MIKIIIWVAILLLAILLRKRIVDGVVGVVFFVGVLFFSVFMLDAFTTFELRKYVPMSGYDKTVEDPKGVAGQLAGDAKNVGGKVVDKINDRGDELDEVYGTGLDEEEKKESKKEDKKEKENKKDKVREDKQDKNSKKNEDSKGTGIAKVKGEVVLPYKGVARGIDEKYPDMGEKDRALALSLVPMLEMHYIGDEYEIWNDKTEDGVHIKKIER